jgi:NDP-sugar pyrophosphorylase family protein
MEKIRVSLSLRKDLIDKIDRNIDKLVIKSRSDAVEQIIEKHLESKVCVILAGGDPKYLWINEFKTYRPLVIIKHRALIEDIILKAKGFNYNNFIIVGSKELNTRIFELLGNGEKLNCNIKYVEENHHGDTANSLNLVKDQIKNTFLFLPSDHYFDFDLKKLEQIHKINNFVATLAIYGGIKYDNNRSAIVELDGNEVINYWDTPKQDKTLLTSTMIGFAEPEIFDYIENKKTSLHNDVFPKLSRNKKLGGALLSTKFVNVHTKKDIETVKNLVV